MRRELHYIPWDPMKGFAGCSRPISLKVKPGWVWTLIGETDEKKRPEIPDRLMHNINAFFEDYVHDWNWQAGTFRLYSRIISSGNWVVLEYVGT